MQAGHKLRFPGRSSFSSFSGHGDERGVFVFSFSPFLSGNARRDENENFQGLPGETRAREELVSD